MALQIAAVVAKIGAAGAKAIKGAAVAGGKAGKAGKSGAIDTRLQIEGIPELSRALRQVGREHQKELGQVHKQLGEKVIAKIGGKSTGVGQGRGETVRPSASASQAQLRVGGSHRSRRVQQWGVRPVRPHPVRPFIAGAAASMSSEIEAEYLKSVERVAKKAGLA